MKLSKFKNLFIMTLLLQSFHLWAQEPRNTLLESTSTMEAPDLSKRTKSLDLWKVFFGPSYAVNLNENNMLYTVGVGKHFEVTETGEIRAETSFSAHRDTRIWNLGLGYGYVPFMNNVSPVLGGYFGLGARDSKTTKSSFGFTGSVFGGLRFFRQADRQMEVLARYTTGFNDNGVGLPGEVSLSVGVLF